MVRSGIVLLAAAYQPTSQQRKNCHPARLPTTKQQTEAELTPSTDQTSTANPVIGATLEGSVFSKYSGFCSKSSGVWKEVAQQEARVARSRVVGYK